MASPSFSSSCIYVSPHLYVLLSFVVYPYDTVARRIFLLKKVLADSLKSCSCNDTHAIHTTTHNQTTHTHTQTHTHLLSLAFSFSLFFAIFLSHTHNTHTCSPSLFHKHCKTHTTYTRQLHKHTRPRLKPTAGTCIDQTFWNANGIDACPAKELTNSLLLNAHVLVYAPIVNAVAACALDLWPCYKGKPVYI